MTKSDNANDESINHEVLDLLDRISDKIMERGILSEYIEEGSLAGVTLRINGNKEVFELIIKLQVDGREEMEISDDEWDYITERVSSYFEEKGFLIFTREYDFWHYITRKKNYDMPFNLISEKFRMQYLFDTKNFNIFHFCRRN